MERSSLAICIPAYNASKYLPKLLKSVAAQIIPFDEILVYNDCSVDNTAEVARHYGARVTEGDVNRGCSYGKNALASIAKSEWLHFHDADDDLLPNFTSVACRWMKTKNSPDIVLLHYHYKTYAGDRFISEPHYDSVALQADPVKFTITNKLVNFALIKKEAFLHIGGFNTDPQVLFNEDRAFYTKAVLNGLTLGYEPELTCINYYHNNSMSINNSAKCSRSVLEVWKNVIKETQGLYDKEISKQLLDNAAFASAADDWATVKQSVHLAQKIYPLVQPGGSKYFQKLFNIVPFTSFYIREMMIRHLTTKRKKQPHKSGLLV